MVTEQEVIEELTRYYRAMDESISEAAPAWHSERSPRGNRQPWQVQLLATAALLALIIGIGVLIREARLHNSMAPVTSPSPQAGAPLVISNGGPFTPLGALDERDGWVASSSGLSMTHDGGRTWQKITPGSEFLPYCCDVSFVSPRDGWAWQPFPSSMGSFTILRTKDGGASWSKIGQAAPVSAQAQYPSLLFIDAKLGWIIYQDFHDGVFTGFLQQTVDGGASWTVLPPLPALPVQQPFFRETTARFITSSRGWFIGTDADGIQHLYMTNDGGHSWSLQHLPVSASESRKAMPLALPTFLSGGRGIVPFTLDDGRILLALSTDGGQSWKLDSGTSQILPSGDGHRSADQAVQAPSYSGRGIVAIVIAAQLALNRGNGWTLIKPSGLSNAIADLEFGTPQMGWALVNHRCSTVGCEGTQFELVKTSDGGRTWHSARQ